MATKIFVNLPVKNLAETVAFFTKLGYTFDAQFTDENATCMHVSEDIFVMLLVEPFFESFTNRKVADTKTSIESMITLSADSREAVNEIVEKALAAGATSPNPIQDYPYMYGRGFEDLDGHHWDFTYMDMSAFSDAAKS